MFVRSATAGIGIEIPLAISGEKVAPPTTMISSAARIRPISAPTGAYSSTPARSSAKSISSIMTTNRKSTATAPT
ncbi:hypothetical protein D3C86_1718470 [compost metagenome]